ncbi:glycosyltransferase family 4 protein [Chryseobacterium hispalense]|uniref:glycosyltransferase family 4 protein n=1 Tax=Chryseobacterium hispalense TaxID=1453492 RepID=UPI003919CE1C
MQSKKIIMFQDFFGLNYTYQENLLTKYYVELGHRVVVICSTYESVFDYQHDKYDKTKKESVIEYMGAKIIRLPYSINILNKIKKHNGIFEILQREKPDLIYAHDIHFNIKEAVKYVKKNPSCKIIMDYHADFSNSANGWASLNILHKIIRKNFLYKYLKYIKRIYPIVPASAHFLNQVYKIPYKDMTLLPLGCDYLKSIEVMKNTNKFAVRKKMGIDEADFVIMTGGKFDPLKKTEILIQAVNKINDPDIHLIIFGKASDENLDYENKLKSMSENSNIHFTGWLNNDSVMELMAVSDVAIYPSSQSVVWQQSIGMHLPLIIGNLGGQEPEYLNRHDNVIILDTEEITQENFEKHIINLKDDPELLQKMKFGAQRVASEYLDYRIICETTLEVLQADYP